MRKQICVALIICALVGCGESGKSDNRLDNRSTLDYLLAGSSGARPSVLAARATDGTLKFASETGQLSDPVSALSLLDGWSTTQAIALTPITETGVTIPAPAPAAFEQTLAPVYLFEVGFDEVSNKLTLAGAKALQYGRDFTVSDQGGRLNVVPLKPLNPSSYYQIVVTDSLQDSQGHGVISGPDYLFYRQGQGSSGQDKQISEQLNQQESLFEALTGHRRERVIFSDVFATQSGADALLAVKSAAATIAQSAGLMANAVWPYDGAGQLASVPLYQFSDVEQGEDFLSQLSNEPFLAKEQQEALTQAVLDSPLLSQVAAITKVYHSKLNLPYFLASPALAGSWEKAKQRPWQGAGDSLYTIVNHLKAGDPALLAKLTQLGIDGASLPALISNPRHFNELQPILHKLAGQSLGQGGQALDWERNISRFNPLPALQSVQAVPFLLFSASPLDKVTDLIIYQHGVTSVKENAYALVLSQIAAGLGAGKQVALLAIDHPLHGERGFALSQSMQTVTTSENPTPYLNLAYLPVARDNLKQSVADLLGLRLAVGLANNSGQLGLQGRLRVHFLGHSLGAITGTNLLAIAKPSLDQPELDRLFQFDSAALAMPGGSIAPLLLNSATFGPSIKMSVLTAADANFASGFRAYAGLCQQALAACFVQDYLPSLGAAMQARANEQLQRYSFVAQSLLDSADAINLSQGIAPTLPLFATEVVGDGAVNLPDQVIPNHVSGAPLAGTEPLIKQLALQPFNQDGSAKHHVARFVAGGHSSLLAPDVAFDPQGELTEEIQSLLGQFFMSQGERVQVRQPHLLKR